MTTLYTVEYRGNKSRLVCNGRVYAVGRELDMLELAQTKNSYNDILEALWVCHHHNKLYLGENHNTVIQSGEALAKAKAVQS